MKRAHRLIYSIGSIAVISTGWICVAGCGTAPVPAPTAYTAFNSKPGTFACEYPEGWQEEGGGKRGLEWAKFTSGPAEIRIDTGVGASLIGDLARSANTLEGGEVLPEEEPVHQVHLAYEKDAAKSFSGYNEVAQPEIIDIPIGGARRSEFTAQSTFGSALHGYRATALTRDKGVFITCICPETDWKTLQPAFDHVLKSLKRGVAE
jgi:hypothetical protein